MPIKVKNLTSSYVDIDIIKGITHNFKKNSITCIIGQNGCGKSTFLKTLSKMLNINSGSIDISGRDINSMNSKEIALKLGFLTQSSETHKGLTVYDLISRGRYPHKGILQINSIKDEKIIENAIKLTELEHIKNKNLDDISGGQKQRAWIGMILAQDTDILLLDEPTTYLDIHHREEIINLIIKLRNTYDKTIITVLHDIYEAQILADYIIGIKDGKIFNKGMATELINKDFLENLFEVDCDEYKFENRNYYLPSIQRTQLKKINKNYIYEISKLNVSYEKYNVLKDINLTFDEGLIHCIMGINGSGKSTLIKAMVQENTTISGSLSLLNKKLNSYSNKELSNLIAYLPQEEDFPKGFTVEEYVNLGRFSYNNWYSQWTRNDKKIVFESLEKVGAEKYIKNTLVNLSGGQKQRVRIARLLAQKSDILFLDEPCSFLDIKGQKEVLDCIRQISINEKKTIIMILHDPWQATLYGNKLHIIDENIVKYSGDLEGFINEENLNELYKINWNKAISGNNCVYFPQFGK